MTRGDKVYLPTRYKSARDRTVYSEIRDKPAEVKESEVDRNKVEDDGIEEGGIDIWVRWTIVR